MNRLFARTLNSSRQLIEEAASGTLVLNERAHELLGESLSDHTRLMVSGS